MVLSERGPPMRRSRKLVVIVGVVLPLVLGLGGAACGGDGDDDEDVSTGQATGTTAPRDATTTEDEDEDEATTTTAGAARTDIDPCALLSEAELEAQSGAAGVDAFEVTKQEAKPPDSRGVFRCDTYFNVIDGSSTITATAAVEVRTKDAAGEYKKLREFGSTEREDVSGLGDKAFWAVEATRLTILDDDLVVIVDVGMPGVIAETNRPVAEALAPIVLGHL